MAISYPLELPSNTGMAKFRLSGRSHVGMTSSPYSAAQQVQSFQGQLWKGAIELPPNLSVADSDEWVGFLLSLNGVEGTFLCGDPLKKQPRGSAKDLPGSPVVNGSNQTGNSIDIRGCPNSVSQYLCMGDYIQIGVGTNSRLYRVLNNINTSSTGNATLDIWPRLRRSPTDGDAIIVSNTKGVFRLATNEPYWEEQNGMFVTHGAIPILESMTGL
jgi:hypothetical protein